MPEFVRDANPDWSQAITMEDYFRSMIIQGQDEKAVELMNCLNDKDKIRYRKIWNELKGLK